MISSSSSEVQPCGQVRGPMAARVPGAPGAVRAVNQASSVRTPATSCSQAARGTGETRPSSRYRVSSSASWRRVRGYEGSGARTYGRRPPGSLGRSPSRRISHSARRPDSTPRAHTSGSPVSGTVRSAWTAASIHASTSAAVGRKPSIAASSSNSPGARLGSAPPGRRYSGRMRPAARVGGSEVASTPAPASTRNTCRSSATRHSSGRARSISRWSGISQRSSNGAARTRTGSGHGPEARASRSVPVRRPGNWATAEWVVRDRVGSNRASRSAPWAVSSAVQRAFRDAGSGAVGQARPGRSGATDHGMRSASGGASSYVTPGMLTASARPGDGNGGGGGGGAQVASRVTVKEKRSPR